jgi:hypothetical protein
MRGRKDVRDMEYERGYFLWKCYMILCVAVVVGGAIASVHLNRPELADQCCGVGFLMAVLGVLFALVGKAFF